MGLTLNIVQRFRQTLRDHSTSPTGNKYLIAIPMPKPEYSVSFCSQRKEMSCSQLPRICFFNLISKAKSSTLY